MRVRVPWSEISALLTGYIAVATWGAAPAPATLEGAATALAAIAAALVPRRAREGPSPAGAEAAAIAGALAAIAIAPTVAGAVPPAGVLPVVHAVALGELLALAVVLSVALPVRPASFRRAALPALAVGAAAIYGLWPRAGFVHPGLRALAPAAALGTVLAFVLALGRPHAPEERARLIAPGLGAAALAVAVCARALLGDRCSPLVLAGGALALVSGITLGSGAIALEHAAGTARRVLTGTAGVAVGVAVVLILPPSYLWLGPLAAVLVALAMQPRVEGQLRPDGGALLDACAAIERALPTVLTLHDLATAVLDPLRLAARDLRAPAALWILERHTRLHLDVAGASTEARLSLDAERAILAWLRARPVTVCADTLRPHLVRRAELRPVVAALDAHDAFAAVPLHDEHELVGVVLVPRGRRSAAPTYEEEVRLGFMARAVAGVLALVCAAERSHTRAVRALGERDEADARRAKLQGELERLEDRERGVRLLRALGSLDAEWIGYSPAMRSLAVAIERAAERDAPVTLLAEPGAGVVAVARALHARSAVREGPFVAFDASSMHPRDALAALVGDDRGPVPRAGWLEHAGAGMLLVEELPALGHEGLVALVEVLRHGSARRVGGVAPYAVRARLVVSSRRALDELDVPAELIARLGHGALLVPPLRARTEDLEALVLMGLDRACRINARSPLGIAPEALAALRGYNWPGNVRELGEVLEGAAARARGARVQLEDLPVQLRVLVGAAASDDAPGPGLGPADGGDEERVDDAEVDRQVLLDALAQCGGDRSAAAHLLGLDGAELAAWLGRLGMLD